MLGVPVFGALVLGKLVLELPQFLFEPGMAKFLIASMPVKLEMMLIIINEDKAKIIPMTAKVIVFLDFSVA